MKKILTSCLIICAFIIHTNISSMLVRTTMRMKKMSVQHRKYCLKPSVFSLLSPEEQHTFLTERKQFKQHLDSTIVRNEKLIRNLCAQNTAIHDLVSFTTKNPHEITAHDLSKYERYSEARDTLEDKLRELIKE